MRRLLKLAALLLSCMLAFSSALADELPAPNTGIRIVSWNVSNDTFSTQKHAFSAVLQWANPDIVLLDEVSPSADIEDLEAHLLALSPDRPGAWNMSVGESGGRQRTVIATRAPLTPLPAFTSVVPYPKADMRTILNNMSSRDKTIKNWSMEEGIPVNGAIIQTSEHRLLVVIVDFQCCGNDLESWQELRRRVEAREIRRLIREALEQNEVHGVVFAGDFNMVNSTFPLALLLGPYPVPIAGLIPAEAYHSDGISTWTWDGRGTPFPSNTLDYQLYSPGSLNMRSGLILDSEGVDSRLRRRLGLEVNSSALTGRHRPILVEYEWR